MTTARKNFAYRCGVFSLQKYLTLSSKHAILRPLRTKGADHMEPATVSSCILTLHRRFAAYTTQRLQELGLSFGMMYFIIYVGKHPGCTPSELTQRLHLDWGHSQRSLTKLAEDGFLTKEKSGRSYHLELTEKGRTAFAACHRVFYGWDARNLTGLTADEQRQLLDLLQKAAQKGSM